jgi:ATP dependent DNA ligase domain
MLARPRTLPVGGFIQPCLPIKAPKPPMGAAWLHEIKHDVYRLMARRDPVSIRLITRRGNDWTERYPLVVEAMNHLKVRSCLIDGEVVCCDERGLAIFSTLRQRRNEARAFLFAFDLLEVDGHGESLSRRARDSRQPPTQGQAWGASERAHSASQRRRRVSSRLQAGCRGDRLEAPRLALQVGAVARLAEV